MKLQAGIMIEDGVCLVRALQEGAMGSVWEATHAALGTAVAVKVMLGKQLVSPDARIRFRREAEAIAALDSPHVVRLHGYGEAADGSPFLIMELLDGETLGARLEQLGKLSLDDAAAIVVQVAKALEAVHEQGIIHRDVKPDNIFLVGEDDFPLVKLLDFGMARKARVRNASIVTATGVLVGTPDYMSPEQVLGSKDVDTRSDLWALGVVAYRMITGELPFSGDTPHALVFSICKGELGMVNEQLVPAPLRDWFEQVFQPNPKDRYQTAGELLEAFEHAASGRLSGDFIDEDIGEASTQLFSLAELNPPVLEPPSQAPAGEFDLADQSTEGTKTEVFVVKPGVTPPLEPSVESADDMFSRRAYPGDGMPSSDPLNAGYGVPPSRPSYPEADTSDAFPSNPGYEARSSRPSYPGAEASGAFPSNPGYGGPASGPVSSGEQWSSFGSPVSSGAWPTQAPSSRAAHGHPASSTRPWEPVKPRTPIGKVVGVFVLGFVICLMIVWGLWWAFGAALGFGPSVSPSASPVSTVGETDRTGEALPTSTGPAAAK